MKKIISFLIVFTAVLALSGCGFYNEVTEISTIQKDLNTYIKDSEAHVAEQHKLMTAYNNKFVNEVDSTKSYKALTTEIIPSFEAYAKKMKKSSYKTKEVNKVHETFVEGLGKHVEALSLYKKAFDKGDDNYFSEGDKLIDKSNDLYQQSDQQLLELTKEFHVDLSLEKK